ncbi:unnamed protein product [Diplocarpon coronariae]
MENIPKSSAKLRLLDLGLRVRRAAVSAGVHRTSRDFLLASRGRLAKSSGRAGLSLGIDADSIPPRLFNTIDLINLIPPPTTCGPDQWASISIPSSIPLHSPSPPPPARAQPEASTVGQVWHRFSSPPSGSRQECRPWDFSRQRPGPGAGLRGEKDLLRNLGRGRSIRALSAGRAAAAAARYKDTLRPVSFLNQKSSRSVDNHPLLALSTSLAASQDATLQHTYTFAILEMVPWTDTRILQLLSTVAALLLAYPVSVVSQRGKFVTLEDALDPDTFGVNRATLRWTHLEGDGSYIQKIDGGDLVIDHVVEKRPKKLLRSGRKQDMASGYTEYFVQPSGERLLLASNVTQRYRYSFTANYYVYTVSTQKSAPLDATQNGDIQYACWAPTGNKIAYVKGNNLYIWQNGVSHQITKNGGRGIYNGIPGWVYEEEIFKSNSLLWFSPDGKRLAYLSLDETEIPSYRLPNAIGPGSLSGRNNPSLVELRYPQVGKALPSVSIHVVDLKNLKNTPVSPSPMPFIPEDLIIGEVAWVTPTSNMLLVRTFNRVQKHEKMMMWDVENNFNWVKGERTVNQGWIDNYRSVIYIPGSTSYFDLSDHEGWKHIYEYSNIGPHPRAITSGLWEVDSILHVNWRKKRIYYTSNERNSNERHVFSIGFDGKHKKLHADPIYSGGVWSADFSPGGDYYVISYDGPDVPFQEMMYTGTKLQKLNSLSLFSKAKKIIDKADRFVSKFSGGDKNVGRIVSNNALRAKLHEYNLPTTKWAKIEGPEMLLFDVMVQYPPFFDDRVKYPVIFNLYGVPGTQSTLRTFQPIDFRAYLSSHSQLQYIVVTVDVRGAGRLGRNFRSGVTGNLGTLQATDINYVARRFAAKPFVDKSKMSLMGMGYGAYLAGKIIELDTNMFSSAVLTAPITDWRKYNNVYAERYMDLLGENEMGYEKSAMALSQGYRHLPGVCLVQHGNLDINGNFQASRQLFGEARGQGIKVEQEFYGNEDPVRLSDDLRPAHRMMSRHFFAELRRKPERNHRPIAPAQRPPLPEKPPSQSAAAPPGGTRLVARRCPAPPWAARQTWPRTVGSGSGESGRGTAGQPEAYHVISEVSYCHPAPECGSSGKMLGREGALFIQLERGVGMHGVQVVRSWRRTRQIFACFRGYKRAHGTATGYDGRDASVRDRTIGLGDTKLSIWKIRSGHLFSYTISVPTPLDRLRTRRHRAIDSRPVSRHAAAAAAAVFLYLDTTVGVECQHMTTILHLAISAAHVPLG